MSTTALILMTLAGAGALAGLALVYASWKKPGRPAWLGGGWALLAASLALAFYANADRGVAQIIVVAMAGASAIFALPMLRGLAPPVAEARFRAGEAVAPARQNRLLEVLSGIWTFLVSGPIAGLIALFAAACLFKLIRPAEGNISTAGIVAIIVAVMLWAVISTLLLIEPRQLRRTGYAGAALAATAAFAFI